MEPEKPKIRNKNPKCNWKPGQSGNPNGRPKKGECLTEILRKFAEIKDVEITDKNGNPKKIRRKQALAEKMWNMALVEGDRVVMMYLYDRLDGKPVQTNVNLPGNEENPIYNALCELTEKMGEKKAEDEQN